MTDRPTCQTGWLSAEIKPPLQMHNLPKGVEIIHFVKCGVFVAQSRDTLLCGPPVNAKTKRL